MPTPKKPYLNWPTAAVILGIIGTMAAIFAPLVNADPSGPIVVNDNAIQKSIIDLSVKLQAYQRDTGRELAQMRKYNRQEFVFIKEELYEIKRRLRRK